MHRAANPLAAYLDAQADAISAGLCDADIAALQDIGREIADLASSIANRLAGTSDARMVTTWHGRGERREARTFTAEDLAAALAEGALGELDAYAVVRTACELHLSTASLAVAA